MKLAKLLSPHLASIQSEYDLDVGTFLDVHILLIRRVVFVCLARSLQRAGSFIMRRSVDHAQHHGRIPWCWLPLLTMKSANKWP